MLRRGRGRCSKRLAVSLTIFDIHAFVYTYLYAIFSRLPSINIIKLAISTVQPMMALPHLPLAASRSYSPTDSATPVFQPS